MQTLEEFLGITSPSLLCSSVVLQGEKADSKHTRSGGRGMESLPPTLKKTSPGPQAEEENICFQVSSPSRRPSSPREFKLEAKGSSKEENTRQTQLDFDVTRDSAAVVLQCLQELDGWTVITPRGQAPSA